MLARYAAGPVRGSPALTRNRHGAGTAFYVGTAPDPTTLAALLDRACRAAGVSGHAAPAGVEVVRRRGDGASYLFVVNHRDEAAELVARGRELLTGRHVDGALTVPAGGVAVLREGSA